MMDEITLVQCARRGDAEAFEVLVHRYQNHVYRLALRMCGNAHDAEEVAQEALVAAWRGLPSFRGESKFSSWLYQLTTHAAVDFLRREKRHRNTTPVEEQTELPAEGTPQQAAETTEVREQLRRALLCLTEEHRQIFLLRQMEQLSYEEIGQLLRLESGTVKSRLHRAKKQLQQILLQQGNLFDVPAVKQNREGESTDV